jgi:hypothetical protein
MRQLLTMHCKQNFPACITVEPIKAYFAFTLPNNLILKLIYEH